MWLFFAILAPILFSIVFVLDEYCVGTIFSHPWVGVITSAIATAVVVLIPLPFLIPFIPLTWPGWQIIFFLILAGVIIQINQYFYFHALAHSDAGLVAAYGNLISAFLPIVSYIILNEVLEVINYLGIFIIIITSVMLSISESELQSSRKSFVLIFIASWLYIAAIILMDIAFARVPYFQGFVLVSVGIIIAGSAPLISKKIFTAFIKSVPHNRKLFFLFFGIEIVNLLAYASLQMAIKLGSPTLVSAVEATMPIWTIVVALLFTKFILGHSYKIEFFQWVVRISAIIAMAVGILFIRSF